MKLLRFPLAAILMLSGLAPLSLAAPTGAQISDVIEQAAGLHSRYEVLYRYDHHDSWRVYGSYHTDDDAHHAARHLRSQGFEARVHHHF